MMQMTIFCLDFTQKTHEWINARGDQYDVLLLNFNYIDFNTSELLGTADHDAEELHNDPIKYAILHKIVNFGVYKLSSFPRRRRFRPG